MTEVHTDRVEFGAGQQPPKTQNTTRETNPRPDGTVVQPATSLQPANVRSVQPGDDVANPLQEEKIRCRVRDGVEFYAQFADGNLVKGGEEYDVPISMARAASMFLDDISSGEPKSVPHEQQRIGRDVERAQLAGRPRHERIGALEDEMKRLDERKAQVQTQLDHEKSELAEAQKQTQQQTQPAQAAQVGDKNEPAQVQAQPGDRKA